MLYNDIMNNLTINSIKGVGIDIVEIDRFKNTIKNQRFLDRVYSKEEQKFLSERALQSYAGNFAVKEAFVKALGTGFVDISPNEIEVLRDLNKAPYVNLTPKILSLLEKRKASTIHISISHSKKIAEAICIIE